MLTIKTATDAIHAIEFCGISSMTGSLVICIKKTKDFSEYESEFSNPSNTEQITYEDGHAPALEYDGYTEIRFLIDSPANNTVKVFLKKP